MISGNLFILFQKVKLIGIWVYLYRLSFDIEHIRSNVYYSRKGVDKRILCADHKVNHTITDENNKVNQSCIREFCVRITLTMEKIEAIVK